MPTHYNEGQENQLAQSVTAVLVMVEATVWVAYIDQVPEISVEGGTAHEAFRRLVAQLHQGDYPWLHPGPPTITRVKLVRPSVPW
jgi:hypothetical protein